MTYSYAKLGDIATYINGYAFKPKDHGTKGLPIIRIQDLTGSSNDRGYYAGEYPSKIEINNGDVLISWSASLGVYVWNKGKALLNQHIFKVKFDKKDIDKDYFVYAVRFNLTKLKQLTHGATMKHVVKKDFENVLIPYPSLKRQREIAYVLDKLERNLTQKSQELDKLDELIKARFVEMFGNYPNNEKSWPVGKIKDLVLDVRYGTSKKATDGTSGKYPYLRMNNITYDGNLNLSDLKTIDLPLEDLEKYTVQKGDLLFNRTNSRDLVGKTCVYDLDKTMVLAGFIIRVRLDTTVANPVFVSKFLNTGYSKLLLRTICKNASGQSNINAKEMQDIKIYVPPISLQNEFANFVQQVDKSKFENIVYLNKTLSMKILGQLGDVFRD